MKHGVSQSYCLGVDTLSMSKQLNDKGLSLEYIERNDFMTFICGKYSKDSIILGCDSLVTTKAGNVYNRKYFINKKESLIVLYAGCSMIRQQNGNLLYIGDIIEYDINKYNGVNILEIKETLLNDIVRFLPRDDDFLGQILVAYQQNELLILEGYEINVKKSSRIDEYNIFKYYDSQSYYFHSDELVTFGIVSNQEANRQYQLMEGVEREKIEQIITQYVRNSGYPTVGGKTTIIELTKQGIKIFE